MKWHKEGKKRQEELRRVKEVKVERKCQLFSWFFLAQIYVVETLIFAEQKSTSFRKAADNGNDAVTYALCFCIWVWLSLYFVCFTVKILFILAVTLLASTIFFHRKWRWHIYLLQVCATFSFYQVKTCTSTAWKRSAKWEQKKKHTHTRLCLIIQFNWFTKVTHKEAKEKKNSKWCARQNFLLLLWRHFNLPTFNVVTFFGVSSDSEYSLCPFFTLHLSHPPHFHLNLWSEIELWILQTSNQCNECVSL